MSKLEVGTEVWADPSSPLGIALSESDGRPGVVVHVFPEVEPDFDEVDPEFGWNSDDVVVRWNNGTQRSYQYGHITPFDPDDELDWEYDTLNDFPTTQPIVVHRSAYLDELRVRRNRIHDGLFALSQVSGIGQHDMKVAHATLTAARDIVDAQIEQEKEKFNV